MNQENQSQCCKWCSMPKEKRYLIVGLFASFLMHGLVLGGVAYYSKNTLRYGGPLDIKTDIRTTVIFPPNVPILGGN